MAQNIPVPDQIKKPTPLYAVVGAGEAVIEKIRGIDLDPDSVRGQVKDIPTKAQATATKAQAKATERFGTVVDDVKHLPDQLRALPDRAQAVAMQAMGQATEAYADFAKRGEIVVQRVRGQAVAGAAESEVKKTTKPASTTAKSTTSPKKSTSRAKKTTDSTD
jgi:cation transport regulator ChaB